MIFRSVLWLGNLKTGVAMNLFSRERFKIILNSPFALGTAKMCERKHFCKGTFVIAPCEWNFSTRGVNAACVGGEDSGGRRVEGALPAHFSCKPELIILLIKRGARLQASLNLNNLAPTAPSILVPPAGELQSTLEISLGTKILVGPPLSTKILLGLYRVRGDFAWLSASCELVSLGHYLPSIIC